MLDTKRIIQLGLGVAIGMLAYHFIQKAMNKSVLDNGVAGAGGRLRPSRIDTPCQSVKCGDPKPGSGWTGYVQCCDPALSKGTCCDMLIGTQYEQGVW